MPLRKSSSIFTIKQRNYLLSNTFRIVIQPRASNCGIRPYPVFANTEQLDDLLVASHEAKTNAYNRYSNFRVGAALLCQDGTVIRGCSVDNASYGLTICAERTALVKAVSEGHRKFQAIAIASDLANSFITPCGACRQFLVEFGMDWDVFMTKPDLTYTQMKTGDLSPLCFVPERLEEEKISQLA